MAPLYFDEKLIVVNKANDPIIRDLIDENTFDLSDMKLEMEMAKMLGDIDRIKELAVKIRKHNDSL